MNDRDPYDEPDMRDLRQDVEPPPGLEDRVVEEARVRGLISRTGPAAQRTLPSGGRHLAKALAAAAVIAGAFVAGRMSVNMPSAARDGVVAAAQVPAGASGQQRFLAAVFVDSAVQARLTPDGGARLTRELVGWANELRSEDRLVYADHVDRRGGVLLGPDGEARPLEPFVAAERLGGLFVIEAADYDTALSILRESPYLAFGGSFGVIRVNPD